MEDTPIVTSTAINATAPTSLNATVDDGTTTVAADQPIVIQPIVTDHPATIAAAPATLTMADGTQVVMANVPVAPQVYSIVHPAHALLTEMEVFVQRMEDAVKVDMQALINKIRETL